MKISLIPILVDNYVWIISRAGVAVVVDPGEAAPVGRHLETEGLRCGAILITHHHHDHVDGAETLRSTLSCPVFGPSNEAIDSVTDPVEDDAVIDVAGMTFRVLSVPGHTRGHLAYRCENRLLCGDALFTGGCGRIFEGTPETMYRSLMRMAALDHRTEVCCAHEYTVANLEFALTVEPGNPRVDRRLRRARTLRATGCPTVPAVLSEELETNPFLRCTAPSIVDAVSRNEGRVLEPGLEVFAALRRWKDRFRPR